MHQPFLLAASTIWSYISWCRILSSRLLLGKPLYMKNSAPSNNNNDSGDYFYTVSQKNAPTLKRYSSKL